MTLFGAFPMKNPMETNEGKHIVHDIFQQIALILLMLFMFLFMHDILKKLFSKLHLQNRADIEAMHHFVTGAQLLASAKSSQTHYGANSLAKEAEAEKAIGLDLKDAAAYLLKALVLEMQSFKTSTLDSFDMALLPLAVKSLIDKEKRDMLFKRGNLKMMMNLYGRVNSTIMDLTKSIKLSLENTKDLCLLGECYKAKKVKEEARETYENALNVEPELAIAKKALSRLESQED